MTNAQLDLAELEALLNDDSDGQRFANFLQKKQGKVRQHRRVFGEIDAPRLSLKVRVQKVQKSSDVENQQNQEVILDKRSSQLEDNAEDNVVASSLPITNNGTFQKGANNTTPDRIKSPLLRLSALKSGGGVSDRLRRYSLKRASGITPKRRTLLKEFESTLDAADFLPPISSTPNTIHATEANISSFRSERVEANILDPNENTLKNDSPNELNSSKRDTQSELLSLQRKDAELLQILEETMKRAEQHNNKNLSCFECTPNAAPSPNSSRRRTYTLEKGEQLGQIVLTPKKVSSPRQTLQQELQQPTQIQKTTTAQVQKTQKLFQTSLNSTQSTPLKHIVIPETQELPKQAEEVITTFQKSNPNTTMVVIPLYQTFNNGAATPNANETSLNSKELPEITNSQPKNSKINKTTEPNKETDSIPVQAESTQGCDNDIDNLRLSDILTDDEDLPRQSQNSIGPINLAAPLSNSTQRTRRLRKRSTTKKKLQMENTLVYSTETENENPGKGYPLNLRRKVSERETETKRKSRNVQLNKPPSNPINGEAFALELERMSYNEILDLRKRNSLGKVFCINGRRSSKQFEKVCKKQQTLEQEIQTELLKRKSASRIVGQIPTTPAENNGVVCEDVSLPQAPVGFQDSSIQRIPAEALIRNEEFDSDVTYSSPVDKTLPARISYVPTSKRISDESVKVQQKKRKRGNDVPEVLQNYMDVSRKIKKTSNKLHKSKRSLYSKGNSDSESNAANSSLEKEFGDVQSFPIVPPPPPRSSATDNECNEIRPVSPPPSFSLMETAICSQLQTDAIISTSPASPPPPPPPPLYANNSADAEVLNPATGVNTIESDKRNVTSVNKTANDKANNEANYSAKADKATINEETVFKKPVGSAPKKGRRGQNNKLQNSQKNSTKLAAQQTISESISVENHSIDDGGVRRSKRGQVPIKQNSARSYIQMMYEEVIKKSQTSKKKRLDSIKKQQKQTEDSKLNEEPIASSTAHSYTAAKTMHIKLNKKNVKKKKDYSMLGDTNCTAGSTINNANRRSPPMATVHEATNEDVFTNNIHAQEHDLEILQTKEKKTKRKYVKKKNLGLEQNLGDASKLIPAPIDELNSIFDQLKNASNVEQQQLSGHKPKTVSLNNTTRNLRIRLKRCELLPSKSVHESVHTQTKENHNSSKQTERPTNNFSNEVSCSSSNYEQGNTESSEHSVNKSGELLTWLKTVCDNPSWSVRSQELFTEMRISTAGNLIFNNLDGIDYAFYDTEHKGSLGYLRFKPRQIKPSKRAKQFHLHFIVLAGEFKFGTNCEHGTFRDGDMVAINKGVRYSIENTTDDIGLLMVIKK